jgi:hypothetical protein
VPVRKQLVPASQVEAKAYFNTPVTRIC